MVELVGSIDREYSYTSLFYVERTLHTRKEMIKKQDDLDGNSLLFGGIFVRLVEMICKFV